MPKFFASETSLSASFCVDVQLIYRGFVLNVFSRSARRELTTKHAIAYEIYNQHNYKIRYVIGHQQPNKSPIRSVVVTKFENGSAYLNRGAYWNRRAHWNESANSRGALIRNRRA